METINHDHIENLFKQLFYQISNIFSSEELNEVNEFLDVGEYGLALETLIDIVVEEKKEISEKACVLIEELAVVMKINKDIKLPRPQITQDRTADYL
jgi:hypothetical protein